MTCWPAANKDAKLISDRQENKRETIVIQIKKSERIEIKSTDKFVSKIENDTHTGTKDNLSATGHCLYLLKTRKSRYDPEMMLYQSRFRTANLKWGKLCKVLNGVRGWNPEKRVNIMDKTSFWNEVKYPESVQAMHTKLVLKRTKDKNQNVSN